MDINSPFSKFEPRFEGSYGKIYIFNFINQNIAVKSYDVFGR